MYISFKFEIKKTKIKFISKIIVKSIVTTKKIWHWLQSFTFIRKIDIRLKAYKF